MSDCKTITFDYFKTDHSEIIIAAKDGEVNFANIYS